MKGILDPYRLGCQLNEGPHAGCRHRTIRAISWHPRIGIAQFSNVDGLALPLKPDPECMGGFLLYLENATHRAYGELHGHGRFALPGWRLQELEACEALEEFVTYYIGPDPAGVHYLQTGPRLDFEETPEEWEALCQQAAPLRDWLAGKPLASLATVTPRRARA